MELMDAKASNFLINIVVAPRRIFGSVARQEVHSLCIQPEKLYPVVKIARGGFAAVTDRQPRRRL